MKHLPGSILPALLLIITLAFTPAGAETGWKAGLAAAKITPTDSLLLAGYANRTEGAAGVLDDLHAKALALEDSNGLRAVIITADVIGFSAEVGGPIRERIAAKHKIPTANILLNASHTHTGPALKLKLSEDGSMTEAQGAKAIAYTRMLQDVCVNLAGEALGKLEPANLNTGSGVVNFPMNRREFTEKGVILGVNPRGLVDRGVSVMSITTADGNMAGVLFRASCHNTTFGSKDNQVSADFAGHAQTHIERALPGVQAMFMQGFAGDTNPYPNSHNDPQKRSSDLIARAHGTELGGEVLRLLKTTTLKPVNGPLGIAYDTAKLPLQEQPASDELQTMAKTAGSWRKWVAERMMADAAAKLPRQSHYEAPVSVWQFGADLTMIGLSGEVVIDYATLIEEAVGPLNLWLNAYCHDTFGYIPSVRILQEGGYETRGLYTGGIGFFAPGAEKVLVEKVRELAERAGRVKQ